MSTMEVIKTMSEIKDLVDNIDTFVPQGAPKNNYFRSDLSGLLVVSLAATYENCVKDIIIEHAENYHPAFGRYAEKQYERLNSRVNLNDLYGYVKKLGQHLKLQFNQELLKAERRITRNPAMDDNGTPRYNKFQIVKEYHRLLDSRHAFAHARQTSITIQEAYRMHRYARFVILAFSRALA
ncbi:TPA: hypothetical protein L0132_003957 [Escherichia coli]|nr:hypothetical protein [Escherichia coli]